MRQLYNIDVALCLAPSLDYRRRNSLPRRTSLMVLSKSVAVSSIVALSLVPDVLVMLRGVRVLLDGPVSVPMEEETVDWACLQARAFLGCLRVKLVTWLHVLAGDHGLFSQVVGGLLNHGCERLKVRTVVPSVRVDVR